MRNVGVVLAGFGMGVGLAACGGSAEKPAAQTATATAAATQKASSTPKAGGAAAKPGAKLSVGETAHVKVKPLNPSNGKKTYKIDAVVLKIEKGTLDDFKNVKLDAKDKKSTPYYVTVRLTSPGGEIPVKDDDPDIRFDGIDDRGQEQGNVTFFGTFDRCDDKEAPAPFVKGKSYESCLTYLVPGGGSIDEVRWSGSDAYLSKPVSWK
ncbi:MAG: hypothetical protein M3O90_07340 [Actinomycetota bacterium]|nr:hypothetical protein [Actinomycetota bacterium]